MPLINGVAKFLQSQTASQTSTDKLIVTTAGDWQQKPDDTRHTQQTLLMQIAQT